MAKDDDIIEEALELFRESDDGSTENRDDALHDINFARLSNQWPDDIKKSREEEGRPCLVINRLPSFIRQVVNDGRQNNPSIAVRPVDSGADVETAEIIGGLIKAIERGSNASVAYDGALENAVTSGFGFFKITTDFAHPNSFDMEARIERVANPFSVHWDVATTQFDASDWNYAFISEMMEKEEFERKYPKAETAGFEPGQGERNTLWIEDDRIRVAEYWRKSMEDRKILLLSNGQVIEESKYEGEAKEFLESQGVTVARERVSEFPVVKRRMITATEILEESDWPGSLIPICPVWGEEVIYEGKRYLKSLVRDAKDPQMMFNFWRSATTELVALAPRAPWVGPEGFVPKGKEEVWRTANTRSHAFLEYNPQYGAPQRQQFAGAPAGAIQEALSAADDMKSIMGIFDASLGARSNETSGRAIMARQREGDVATFHYIDNLSRAIQYAGRVLVEIIPHIYSERQTIQILGEGDAAKVIDLTKQRPDGKLYDFTVGKYDVAVKTGPSFTTQRQEAQEALIEIMRNVPDAAPILGDILVQNMDWPGADGVSKRLKLLLPPQIQQAEAAENQEGLPPEVQQAMMAGQQQIQAAQQMIQQLQSQLQQAAAAPEVAKMQTEQAKVQSEANYKSAQVLIEQEKLRLDEQRLALEARKVALAEAQAHADAAMQAARYVDEKSDKEQAMMMAMATQPVMEPEHREPPPPQVIVVPSGNGASVRNVVVQRGPDGRIIGAQMVEQPV
jgi:hypothetical protein